jgi:hypothetical protein
MPPVAALLGPVNEQIRNRMTLLASGSEPCDGSIPNNLSWLERPDVSQADLPIVHCGSLPG